MHARRAHSGGAGARSPSPTRVDRHGPPYSNGGGSDAAGDTEEDLHRQGVYVTDPQRDESATPERKNRIVVQIHGHDYALGYSSPTELRAAAARAQLYQAQLGVKVKGPYAVGFLAKKIHALTRQFSRAEAEESAFRDADDYDLPNDTVHRDAKHMRELGSFEALVKYHNDAQKTTGLNKTRVNTILSILPNTSHRTVPQPPIVDVTGIQEDGSRYARQK